LDVTCAVEPVFPPQALSMESRRKIRSMFEKELKAVRSLRLMKDIRSVQADKCNCVVMAN
jgi:hypothetical protein